MSQANTHNTPSGRKIYFGLSQWDDSPLDGLQTCSSILKTLQSLIAGCNDLDLIQRTDTFDSVSGLSYLLRAVYEGMDRATDDLYEQRKTLETDVLIKAGLPQEAYNNDHLRQAWRSGYAAAQAQKPVPRKGKAAEA